MPAESRKEVRKRILSQATELFRERGYHSVTLDDIAKAVNHSKVIIYRYWESKEELLYEITKRSHLAVIDGLTKICQSNDPPEVKLLRAVENHVLQAMSNVGVPPFTGKLSQEVGLSPQHKQVIIKLRDKYDASLRQIIEEGIQQRRFTPCDARIVGFAITGA